jgi:hypothetical protein
VSQAQVDIQAQAAIQAQVDILAPVDSVDSVDIQVCVAPLKEKPLLS